MGSAHNRSQKSPSLGISLNLSILPRFSNYVVLVCTELRDVEIPPCRQRKVRSIVAARGIPLNKLKNEEYIS